MASLGELVMFLTIDKTKFSQGLNDANKEVAGASKDWKAIGGQMKQVGGAMTAGITAPILAIGTASFLAAADFSDAYDLIQDKTGATGAELEGLNQSFKNIYGTVPEDASTVAEAIGGINARLGLTGPALETMTADLLNFARTANVDVGTAVQTVTRTFGDWSIASEDQSGAMDYLLKVSQATGTSATDLATKLVAYGAPLRQLGFDFETSAAMMGKFEAEGVNSELVLGSLRIALGKMANEGITDTNVALQTLIDQIKGAGDTGTANALAIETFGARAGPDMAAAIREGRFEISGLVTDLNATPSVLQGASAEAYTFNERMAMMKNRVQEAIVPLGEELMSAFEDLIPTIQTIIGLVTKVVEWFTNLDSTSKTIIFALIALVAAVGPFLMILGQFLTIMPALSAAYTAITGLTWAQVAANLALLATVLIYVVIILAVIAVIWLLWKNWDEIAGFLSDCWEGLKDVFEAVWDAIVAYFEFVWNTIKTLAEYWWKFIEATIIEPIKFVYEFIKEVWEAVTTFLELAWGKIVEFAEIAWGLFKDVIITPIQELFDFIVGIWDTILETLTGIWDRMVEMARTVFKIFTSVIVDPIKDALKFLTGLWEGFVKGLSNMWNGLVNAAGNIWEKITDIIKAPINMVIGFANYLIRMINSISFQVPDWVPLIGGNTFGFNLREVAYLAEGGIVTAPTMAMVGERGAEAVIPLDEYTGLNAGQVTNNFFIQNDDPEAVAEKIVKKIYRKTGVRLGGS